MIFTTQSVRLWGWRVNNFEYIKSLSLEEMAEFSFLEFWTESKEGKHFRYKVGFDGMPYCTLRELIQANIKWLQAERKDKNDGKRNNN